MTQDIDFLLYPSYENALKVMKSLEEFGFGEAGIPQSYFEKEGSAIHLGVEPNRIDLLTSLKGVSNDHVFSDLRRVDLEGVQINIISLTDPLESKRQSARPRDKADADELSKSQS